MKSRKSAKVSKKSTRADLHRKSLRGALRSFETLEDRKLLAATPWSDGLYYPPIAAYTGRLTPGMTANQYLQRAEATFSQLGGVGLAGEGAPGAPFAGTDTEPNNTPAQAQLIPLGTQNGQSIRATITGTTTNTLDYDFYAVDLRAGDILDGQITAATGLWDLSIRNASNQEVAGTNAPIRPVPQQILDPYPNVSPLSRDGLASLSITIPTSGRYYVRVGDGPGPYTLTLNVFRPVLESQPVGTKQILYLDFDGADVPLETFARGQLGLGTRRLSPLSNFLAGWNLSPADENLVINSIIHNVAFRFTGTIPTSGTNGHFSATGIAGQFDLEIRNSRDHADPWGQPNVSRIIVGGTQTELGIGGIYGIAQSVDIGNFSTTETGVVLLDVLSQPGVPAPGPAASVNDIPISGTKTKIDLIGEIVGNIVAHEAGHYFGNWHQVNSPYLTMSTGLGVEQDAAVGPDGVYGTADDGPRVVFGTGRYDATAGLIPFGIENTAANISFALSTGTTGGGIISGNVFDDRNLNRVRDGGDLALAGVTVYTDLNNDGAFNPGEFKSISDGNGNYQLTVPAGNYVLRSVAPLGYRVIAPAGNGHVFSVTAGGTVANRDFANELINQNFSGKKFNDLNGNGVKEANEPGIGGVFIYIDVDKDGRLDIGEPTTQTLADGTYTLNFPAGAGVHHIREVVTAGYTQTFPGAATNFQHVVTLTGNPTIDAPRRAGLDFGNTLTIDYGDAPVSYGVAAHGIVPGLHLGSLVDAEQASQFSADALGDDQNNLDDEDGITPLTPFVVGSGGNEVSVTATNTTGQTAFVHAWIDLNQDGTFSASEKLISNQPIASSVTTTVSFAIPSGALVGNTFARVRYGLERDVAATGTVASGEVEDYAVTLVGSFNLAVNDNVSARRNEGTLIDVLANDFRAPVGEVLTISNVQRTSDQGGSVEIRATASGDRLFYTPPGGFIGQDQFIYEVTNSRGATGTATVFVDVSLFFDNPVAIDDSFDVPKNGVDIPLNVLANDIEGVGGALTITSVAGGDKGGAVSIAPGGKSLRYTPARDFDSTEFITYTARDASGKESTATVTVHILPRNVANEKVQIRLRATNLSGQEISSIPQGEQFKVDFLIDDLRFDTNNPSPGAAAGVFSAYADLLYNMQLVSTVAPSGAPAGFNFDVDFFSQYEAGQRGDATIPGIIDEFGAFFGGLSMNQPNEVRLASITFEARAAGIARFTPDPSDNRPLNETTLFDSSGTAVPTEQIRYLGTSIEIIGDGARFPVAVDDTRFVTGARLDIDVLANDLAGSAGPITVASFTTPGNGTVTREGTRLRYTPGLGFTNGFDQFQYTIVDSRGIQSTATVSLRVGTNAGLDDIVDMELQVTALDGVTPLTQVPVGSEFLLVGYVKDLRGTGTDRGIFATYQDILYNASRVSPVVDSTNNLGFAADFTARTGEPLSGQYQRAIEGDIRTPGLINEIGAVATSNLPLNPGTARFEVFRIKLRANATGTAEFYGDPADISPLHDTLTYEPVSRVTNDKIGFGFDSVTIVAGAAGEGEGFTNRINPLDVNADGYVSPIDALAVINSLNSGGSRPLFGSNVGGEGEGSTARMYIDTNADGYLSPIDVLGVINHLNRSGSGEGEGEAANMLLSYLTGAPAPAPAVAESEDASAADSSVAPVANSSSGSIGARMTDYAYGPSRDDMQAAHDDIFGDDDESMDELLSQLAPEIEERWKKR